MKGLFEQEIRDLYDAEKQLVKALPKMAKAAESEDLRSCFQEHLEVTKGQVTRLEEVFRSLDAKPRGKTCDGMKGLIEEAKKAMEEIDAGGLRDVALIAAAKRVEHYEMAAYQTVIKLAEAMENSTASGLLGETLSEEEEADGNLTALCDELLEGAMTSAEEETEDMPARTAAKKRRAG